LILSSDKPINHYLHDLSLKTLTFKQRLYLNSLLINMDNKKNKFLSEHHLIDLFPNRFSFHLWKKNIKNPIYYTINITFTKVELFAIHCSINQFVRFLQVKKIIIIADSLHIAKSIFDLLMYSYQIHSTTISYKFKKFFMWSNDNHIEFWDCSSKLN